MLEGYWITDYTGCGYTHDLPPVDVYTYDACNVCRHPGEEESVPTRRVRSAHSPAIARVRKPSPNCLYTCTVNLE